MQTQAEREPVRAAGAAQRAARARAPSARAASPAAPADGGVARALGAGPRVGALLQMKQALDARPAAGELRGLGDTLGRGAARQSAPAMRSVVQGVFMNGPGLAGAADAKRTSLRNLLANVNNAQLNQLRNAPNVQVVFDLDDQQDVNPGDTGLRFQDARGGAWQHVFYANAGVQYPATRVEINVRDWFVEKYDLGTVVSMLMHELGAHVLPFTGTLIHMTQPGGAGDDEMQDMHDSTESQEHLNAQTPGRQAHDDYGQMVQDTAGTLTGMGENAAADATVVGYLMDLASLDRGGRRIKYPVGGQDRGIAGNYEFLRLTTPWLNAYNVPALTRAGVWRHYLGYYAAGLPAGIRQALADRRVQAAGGLALLGTLYATGALGWMGRQLTGLGETMGGMLGGGEGGGEGGEL